MIYRQSKKLLTFIRQWQNMKMIASLAAIVLLTGCAGTVYRKSLEVYCPPMADYSEEYNNKLADELTSLPQDSEAIETAVADYIHLRDRIRACEEKKDNL